MIYKTFKKNLLFCVVAFTLPVVIIVIALIGLHIVPFGDNTLVISDANGLYINYLGYYGMVEQTGCIYMECGCGNLHASIFSDVIVRRPFDFSECEIGEPGIIQVVSTIPESYPGHSLLTEDMGVVLGVDDCPCGRKGKYFKIIGRMKSAEIRGCSDTYADRYQSGNIG